MNGRHHLELFDDLKISNVTDVTKAFDIFHNHKASNIMDS